MAVIVKHVLNKQLYVLISSSYSYFKDSIPSFLGGTLFPHEEEGLFDLTSVADEYGRIQWFPTEELRVIGVDGKEINSILDDFRSNNPKTAVYPTEEIEEDKCPACGFKINCYDAECPSCGLVFVVEE